MVEITNLTKSITDEVFLKVVVKKSLAIVNHKKPSSLSVVLVGEDKIKEINRKYRRKNKTTDVLSFEGLNEIFICPAFVKKQAKKMGLLFKSELSRVLIHGILHLAGYDHEQNKNEAVIMRKLENKILVSL